MKLRFFFILIFYIFPQDIFCVDYTSIEVVPPEIQLGKIFVTETIKSKFIIRNVGNVPLQIKKIRPSCDCLIIQSYHPEIPSDGQVVGNNLKDAKTNNGGSIGRYTNPLFTLGIKERWFSLFNIQP